MVASSLRKKGYRVDVEPRFRTPEGTRVPDIVAYNDRESMVVDVQVVGTIMSTELAEQTKVSYYATNGSLMDQIQAATGFRPDVLAPTITFKGTWSRGGRETAKRCGLTLKDVRNLTLTCLVWTYRTFGMFVNAT